MAVYNFKVEEVNRDGYIAWDAIDEKKNDRIPLNTSGKHDAGAYPEIENHLQSKYGVVVDLVYQEDAGDVFDQGKQEWRFVRGTDEVVVKDMARTVLRVTYSG